MPTSITAANFTDGQDKRLTLGNAQVARKLAIGNNFVRIRIGMRLAFGDAGANITGTPRFWLGLLSNPSGSPLSNGPLDATTSHFVGAVSVDPTWERTVVGVANYAVASGAAQACIVKRIGAVDTTVNITGYPVRFISATPGTVRCACVLDITKGSPNFSLQNVIVNTTAGFGTGDVSMAELIQAMEISAMSGVATFLSGVTGMAYTQGAVASIAVNEITDGPLNAICVAWDRSTPLLYISECFYCIFAT